MLDYIINFGEQSGFYQFFTVGQGWKNLIMIAIACLLCWLAIHKKFEPLLLLPIAIGMLLTNLPGAGVYNEALFAGGHVHWDLFGGEPITQELIDTLINVDKVDPSSAVITYLQSNVGNTITPGLIDVLYLGVKLGIYPCLIFIGVGAMTDFGPLIANPKSLILGAAAQIGIFATYAAAVAMGFTGAEAGSIGIIGGADGPTAIFVTSKLAPHLLGPIAVAAYSYMALVPVIQPPIMRLLTTKEERAIVMKPLREVTKVQKILFPVIVTILVALIVPSAAPLIGCLMFGNLLKECGVCDRLSKTVQNELMNIVTVFLGISVGATATAATFLSFNTIKIIIMGVVAFGVATACGILIAKLMNVFLPEGKKINPLIGSAGVSAVPMAARVSQKEGQRENPGNFLLMHAMGPNVAGVIGSAIAAGVLIALFGA
ncbi:MAG: sodium ion-translocating decarboxylase subunit beta [Clostridia bacterium]|nr:sodium ion-translocating decarboxylase subunit beta [Clostridia bacterium]